MNKDEILEKLSLLKFNKEDYIIISGAAMVIQDVKELTNDIDLSITSKLEHELIANKCKYHLGMNNTPIYELDKIEMFSDYYDDTEFIIKYGYRVATINSILKLKKRLNREKDNDDIILLTHLINNKNLDD